MSGLRRRGLTGSNGWTAFSGTITGISLSGDPELACAFGGVVKRELTPRSGHRYSVQANCKCGWSYTWFTNSLAVTQAIADAEWKKHAQVPF